MIVGVKGQTCPSLSKNSAGLLKSTATLGDPQLLKEALFAVATLFLDPANSAVPNTAPELAALSSYHSCGPSWAKSATKEAMSSMATEPSLAACQVLEAVQIYWFGVGNPNTGDLCIALAYRFCSVAGYKHDLSSDSTDIALLLDSELQRRCFWACWTSVCFAGGPMPYVTAAWTEAAMVPLPARIITSVSGWSIQRAQSMDENWSPVLLDLQQDGESLANAAAVLMKLVGVWAKVESFTRTHLHSLSSSSVDEMLAISELAKRIHTNSATTSYRLALSKANDAADLRFLEISDALYHLGQMTLHSKAVPFFSGRSTRPPIPSEVTRSSAKTMLQHADSYVQILQPYLDNMQDATVLCPLEGFGAFIAAGVLLAAEGSPRRQNMHENFDGDQEKRLYMLKSLICLVETLQRFWKALQAPYEKLCAAIKASPHHHFLLPESATNHPASSRMPNSTDPEACDSGQRRPFPGETSSSRDPNLSDHYQPSQNMGLNCHGMAQISSQSSDVQALGKRDQVLERSGPVIEANQLFHLDMSDEDWWNLPLADEGGEFPGLEWFDVFNGSSSSFLA
ncbi:hypothetical protein H2200_004052 [Cladophialophora chaetospira]|uniref:Transcription factor domain-containing protein n=1 Tax=Cladophialophora chaetospira TaxID=386627 RepID=A0AA39CLB1_9EURO|nr:hypothetical protein H2200_004052 [Cladophialophora chaetospira]